LNDPAEDEAMDRFWVFLEAIAGILEKDLTVEAIKQELSRMPQPERERIAHHLRIVAEKIPQLAAGGGGLPQRIGKDQQIV
jgi:hypothetical protein